MPATRSQTPRSVYRGRVRLLARVGFPGSFNVSSAAGLERLQAVDLAARARVHPEVLAVPAHRLARSAEMRASDGRKGGDLREILYQGSVIVVGRDEQGPGSTDPDACRSTLATLMVAARRLHVPGCGGE